MNVLDYAEISSLCQLMGMVKRPLFPVMPGESVSDTDCLWRLKGPHGTMEVCVGNNKSIGALSCQVAVDVHFLDKSRRAENQGYEEKEDAIKEIKASAHEIKSGVVREGS